MCLASIPHPYHMVISRLTISFKMATIELKDSCYDSEECIVNDSICESNEEPRTMAVTASARQS